MSQESQPLVSIVIPCYNHEAFVQDCIRSVIDQTYQNIELIIIDDGSKDNSVAKIQELLDQCKACFTRFEFRHRPNVVLSATLNEALEWCRGEYFSVIASDDMMLVDKTEIQVKYLIENDNCIAVFGGYKLIDNNNVIIRESLGCIKAYTFNEIFLHEHDLPAPTQLINTKALNEVGGYCGNMIIEDWYMWLKLSKIGEIHYINHYFSLYRDHFDNVSKKNKIMNKGRHQVINEFKEDFLYNKANFEVKWIYLSELKVSKNFTLLKEVCYIFLSHPFLTLKKIFNKF